MRDPASTTYTGAIETAEDFAHRTYREAYQRGWSRARIEVVLGDGAIRIWNTAAEQFPGAILMVDFYHASEHLHKLSRLLFPSDEAARRGWTTREKTVGASSAPERHRRVGRSSSQLLDSIGRGGAIGTPDPLAQGRRVASKGAIRYSPF
jgi:hypothetical protein